MSNIDQVIQRARQPGGFSEQRQFSVARERAIRKMREFALADPHYYILELIQATVANNGNHVHIDVDETTLQFSYVGGGYAREELAQLFDFLFASKRKLAHSDIRQLALGINALMITEPDRIIIESGDGTLESTDRIEIRGDEETVEVGTPDQSLRGTFIRAEGLDRSLIDHKSRLSRRSYGPPECAAIEKRCLSAPVPIIVNNEPVFGYSSQRTPVLFGYGNVVNFDEGDLYGSIGVPEHPHKESFKLMTFGVWIESSDAALMENTKIGGVVCCDRLNKTADHSGIVRDEEFDRMWARLRPYARQVAEGESGRGTYRVELLSGEEIPSSELREFFRGDDTFVVVPESMDPQGDSEQIAAGIGDALDAPVLRVDEDAMDSVTVLAGRDSELLEPDLDAPRDLEFYRRTPASPPERPWLTGAIELDPLDLESLGSALVAETSVPEEISEEFVEGVGARRSLRGTVYTPESTEDARELHVRILTLDRIVWEGPIQSPFPGHVLDLEMPAVAPSLLRRGVREGEPLARLVAQVVAAKAVDKLRSATQRSLENLSRSDGSVHGDTGRRIALAALARTALKRLREGSSESDRPEVHFAQTRPQPGPDLLELEVFEALDGTAYSLRDLEGLMEETSGLVYGVVPQVEPALEGLDESRILALDLERERQLLAVVGEAAYVRIDRRDLLAESGPFRVRDMATGLRPYPDVPLLVEGADPSSLGPDRRRGFVRDLVEQLVEVYGDDSEEPSIRREAVRHLQWFVCHRARHAPDAPTWGVDRLPLFLDGRSNPVDFQSVRRGLAGDRGIEMVDGRSSDVAELGSVTSAETRDDGPVRQLAMNTWVFHLLAPLGEVRGAFEFDFTEEETREVESTPAEAFLVSRTVDADRLTGRVGIPAEPPDQHAVAIIDDDRTHTYRMLGPAVDFGLTGFLRLTAGAVDSRWDELQSKVAEIGADLARSLTDEILELDSSGDRFERSVQALFGFAGRKLQLARAPDGTVSPHVSHPLAHLVLELPLLPTETGTPISVMRTLREFCAAESPGDSGPGVRLGSRVPEELERWLQRHLSARNIVEPAGETSLEAPETEATSLEERLDRWLRRLRPDVDRSDAPHKNSSAREADRQPDRPRTGRDAPTVVSVSEEDREKRGTGISFDGGCCRYVADGPTLFLDAEHPIVRRAANDVDSEAFAWLLLNCYAHINDLLEPVTNDHELEFQRRVADALDEF